MTRPPDRRPVGRLRWVQVDCPDPERLAAFWAKVLDVAIEARLGDPPQFVNLASAEPGAPQVCFQRVPEPKSVKNRLHFDLQVEDVDEACARVEALGGRRRDDHDFREHGFSWRRMVDPEGNEFCLIYGA
jgi:predicted enzyme related to lactoylglutathione lyase